MLGKQVGLAKKIFIIIVLVVVKSLTQLKR